MMHKLSFDGIADLGAAVLASDDAVTVRVRAGRTGREVKAVVGFDPIQVSDYDRPSSLVREIEKQLRKIQLGGKRPSWRAEALDEDGKPLKGLGVSGRTEAAPALELSTSSAKNPGDLAQAVALVQGVMAPTLQTVVQLVESVRMIMEQQGETIQEMDSNRWQAQAREGQLRVALAVAEKEREIDQMRQGATGLEPEEEAGLELVKQFMGLSAGKAVLTKDMLLKAMRENPEQAIALVTDSEVTAELAKFMASQKENV